MVRLIKIAVLFIPTFLITIKNDKLKKKKNNNNKKKLFQNKQF